MLLWVALVATLFLALTPHPVGGVIENSALRHMLAFAVLPVMTLYAYPRLGAVRVILIYAAFGGLIELAQWAMDAGRSGQWGDWLLDVAATLVAVGIATAVQHGSANRQGSAR